MNKKKNILLIVDFVLMLVFVVLDQFTKYLAVYYLKEMPPIELIKGVFELNYLENRGAAFGLLQDQKIFFVLIAVVILTAIVYVLLKTPYQKMYFKLHITLVLIASGAVGNMIDRIRHDYVVDFLYFSLINFPIFNVADIYVTLSSFFLVILLLFIYKESDLEFLTFRTKKSRDMK